MRGLLLASVFALAAVGCHKAPEELVTVREAGAVEVSSAGAAGDAAPGAVGSPDDAGRLAVHEFCDDAFGADTEHLRSTCSAVDFKVSEGVARAAGRLCATDIASAMSRARATFDPEAARRCVEMLRARPVTQTSQGDTLFAHAPCDRVLLGAEPEGKPCRYSVECRDGLACVDYRPGVDGTCKKPPRTGEACSYQAFATILNAPAAALHHPECARGAWCDGSTCRARAPAGKACTTSNACAEGLSCTMGKCGPFARTGAACATTADCAFGLWCDRAADGGTGRCAERRAEGQPCTDQDSCKGRCEMPKLLDAAPSGHGSCVSVCGSD